MQLPCDIGSFVYVGDILRIRDHCNMPVGKVQIKELQDVLWSFPHSREIRKIYSTFVILFNDQHSGGIVAKVWDGICPHSLTNLTALAELWPAFILQLHKVAVNLITLNISCEDAANLLDSRMAASELQFLQSTLHECHILEHSEVFQPAIVTQRLLLFEDIKSVEKEAMSLLILKDNLRLTGDFDSVVIISDVSN